MRGTATDVQARRRRRWNESQRKIAMYILPINIIALGVYLYCQSMIYGANRTLAMGHDKGLYYAGVFLQTYWGYIVIRDFLLTVQFFIKGHQQAFAAVIALHYLMSCLDNLFLTGLTIWATIEVNSSGAEDYAKAPEESGLPIFVKITILNVIMGYIYVCSHVCAFPIGLWIVSRNPQQFGFRRGEDLNDDELDMLGDTVYAEQIRSQRREAASRAMSNLTMGGFTSVASGLVKADNDANCVICCDLFTEEDDDVTELECD